MFFKKSEPILDNRMKSRTGGASAASRDDDLPTDACRRCLNRFHKPVKQDREISKSQTEKRDSRKEVKFRRI